MATNEMTLERLEYILDMLKELRRMKNIDALPASIHVIAEEAEVETGCNMTGLMNTLAQHIAQQKRQIAWTKDGKQLHSSKKLKRSKLLKMVGE